LSDEDDINIDMTTLLITIAIAYAGLIIAVVWYIKDAPKVEKGEESVSHSVMGMWL